MRLWVKKGKIEKKSKNLHKTKTNLNYLNKMMNILMMKK
jgi:hypothetical protein